MPRFLLEEDDEDLFNFNVIGLQSTLNEDFRFVFHINQYFHTRFERIHDLHILHKKEPFTFSVFQFIDEQNHCKYTLYRNESFVKEISDTNDFSLFSSFDTKHFLLPQYKQFNYLVKMEGEQLDEISLHLHQNSFINYVFTIPLKTLKNKENLI